MPYNKPPKFYKDPIGYMVSKSKSPKERQDALKKRVLKRSPNKGPSELAERIGKRVGRYHSDPLANLKRGMIFKREKSGELIGEPASARKITEDSPGWNWRTMGNKRRGVTLEKRNQ